jgi:protein arginine N-methyltransferase 2
MSKRKAEDAEMEWETHSDTLATTRMMDACASGDIESVIDLLNNAAANENTTSSGLLSPRHLLASTQSNDTGLSPLMVASRFGHSNICQVLLDAGAPWNALDRTGKCAGDHAVECEKWDIVNLLVDVGTKAELILGASIRLARSIEENHSSNATTSPTTETTSSTVTSLGPVSHEPSTKPSYLSHTNVRYDASNTLLLDDDDDAVMMEWERPIMEAHASILTKGGKHSKRILNIGFGLGIIDTAIQSYEPSLHVICEAHPTVYAKMLSDGWDTKTNVRICFGRWQDIMPQLITEGIKFDGIFYDTYGEHFTDLEDFHTAMIQVLDTTTSTTTDDDDDDDDNAAVYSFFNGLAPDNLFFHGVACQCIKVQLGQLGLNAEFVQCEISSNAAVTDEKTWEGVRRPYWHGRSTYYLPIITWKKEK